jgi:arylsulfatase A-like enzyme
VPLPLSRCAAVAALCLAACQEASPSFVVISLDTLRADRLAPWGGRGVTPNLDALARESMVFEHALAPSDMTVLSHAALFTGQAVSALGPVDHRFTLGLGPETLAATLGSVGYRRAAFVAGGDLAPGSGLERGFETWDSVRDGGSLSHTVPPALAWLDDDPGDEPFLLFVHGYDAHARYLKPPPFDGPWATEPPRRLAEKAGTSHGQPRWLDGVAWDRPGLREHLDLSGFRPWGPEARAALRRSGQAADLATVTAEDQAWLVALYDGGASWADAWLGLLLAGLEDRDLLDEVWVVVLSDHGEALGEQGFYGHVLSMTEAVGRVPLMIRAPGGAVVGTESAAVGLGDLMPTLLALADVPAPAAMTGGSLVPALRGQALDPRRTVFAEGVTGQVVAARGSDTLVAAGAPTGTPELADLIRLSALDGPAFETWAGTSPDAVPALQELLAAWREGLVDASGNSAPLSAQRRRSLQERGYWAADP